MKDISANCEPIKCNGPHEAFTNTGNRCAETCSFFPRSCARIEQSGCFCKRLFFKCFLLEDEMIIWKFQVMADIKEIRTQDFAFHEKIALTHKIMMIYQFSDNVFGSLRREFSTSVLNKNHFNWLCS